ncbi:hypothetical protein P7K49_005779 [Saguinus oedipus]|uniref:Collagen alpha-1(I) chain-like n=1 Tax=Saguinus oedipus TaxID=9490 RepID=A0ABQ9W0J2_SAGOE|nr:hypothetical protein P7K49_005779 [Saguinus oedipus]
MKGTRAGTGRAAGRERPRSLCRSAGSPPNFSLAPAARGRRAPQGPTHHRDPHPAGTRTPAAPGLPQPPHPHPSVLRAGERPSGGSAPGEKRKRAREERGSLGDRKEREGGRARAGTAGAASAPRRWTAPAPDPARARSLGEKRGREEGREAGAGGRSRGREENPGSGGEAWAGGRSRGCGEKLGPGGEVGAGRWEKPGLRAEKPGPRGEVGAAGRDPGAEVRRARGAVTFPGRARAVSGGARSGRLSPCGARRAAAAAEGHREEGASLGGAPRPPPASERDEQAEGARGAGKGVDPSDAPPGSLPPAQRLPSLSPRPPPAPPWAPPARLPPATPQQRGGPTPYTVRACQPLRRRRPDSRAEGSGVGGTGEGSLPPFCGDLAPERRPPPRSPPHLRAGEGSPQTPENPFALLAARDPRAGPG